MSALGTIETLSARITDRKRYSTVLRISEALACACCEGVDSVHFTECFKWLSIVIPICLFLLFIKLILQLQYACKFKLLPGPNVHFYLI